MNESIHIHGLEVPVHIGVPEEERAVVQMLWVDVEMRTARAFAMMGDEVGETIDYAAVAEEIVALGAERPRKLIETLASEIRERIEVRFHAAGVKVTVRKKILPNADYVAVVSES